ncbi:MAG TPA: glycoside hydrolase family 9 protein [Verrucomicrobiae bacterium]|nr:glycoside hydrolase family 9 protein [Verrucomicrobiae bacterium]
MGGLRSGTLALLIGLIACGLHAAQQILEDNPLAIMPVGFSRLRLLSPSVLELTLITTEPPASRHGWQFVDRAGRAQLPAPGEFAVFAGATKIEVDQVGFKRRVLYAPFKQRDLRIGNYLYLVLRQPVPEHAQVQVKNPSRRLWGPEAGFTVDNDPQRRSPVIHVNETGYMARFSKKGMVGFYLGSLGELPLTNPKNVSSSSNTELSFALLENHSGKEVFRGNLTARRDRGFAFACYQQVFEADFSTFNTPGEYRLFVPGLGTSFPFWIGDEVAGAFARTYALGIYHQRCGTDNVLPFTRFVHGPCHTAPAEVPDLSARYAAANDSLAKESANCKDNPRHTAPQLKSVAASLYPFVNRGPVDVRGGHHDAGDYSKYTINSAAFIHHLMFAADVFPGVAQLDNLGLPESGDGIGDILQEIKYEADFLAKMQDADGGFYFLVYPRGREYESDVTPDKGDPQVVFPKTTAVTAAASAALAQCASSVAFKTHFPAAASNYLAKAKLGWDFLQRAIAKYGKDGAYQKITHYGDEFMHDDELAWAACELYLATGDPACERKMLEWLNPTDPNTRRWGWWRLYDAYGCAIRSYAFAARTGRLKKDQLHPLLLEQCESEIAAAGEDQLRRAEASAYGTSFPEETKRAQSAGWYFSSDAAFDLAVACQLEYPARRDPRAAMMAAMVSNLNYEQGCNPVNVVYLTGLGWKRQREIVHQFAQNDRRVLPPTGIPLGNIQAGFGWNSVYQDELDKLSFPSDGGGADPYPFYDRWGDGFNLTQEFVIVNQARALGYCAWLMAQTPLKTQAWKSAPAQITTGPSEGAADKSGLTFKISAPGIDLIPARTVWEAEGREPSFGASLQLSPGKPAPRWVEAEAQLPDGRRVFAAHDFAKLP